MQSDKKTYRVFRLQGRNQTISIGALLVSRIWFVFDFTKVGPYRTWSYKVQKYYQRGAYYLVIRNRTDRSDNIILSSLCAVGLFIVSSFECSLHIYENITTTTMP